MSIPEEEKENRRSAQLAKEKSNALAATRSAATSSSVTSASAIPRQPLKRRADDSQSGDNHPSKRIRFPARPRTIMSPDRGLKNQMLAIRRSLKEGKARPGAAPKK